MNKLNKIIIFMVLLTTLVIPVSADNITIELFQNSNDEYFVSYNDNLYECNGDECTFEVGNYTVDTNITEFELSSTGRKKLAKQIALEIDFPEYTGGINETFLIKALDDEGEDIGDRICSHNLETMAPTIEDFDLLDQEKTQLEADNAELMVKGELYDDQQKKDNDVIEIYKEAKEQAELFGIICGFGFAFVILTCTPGGKTSIEFAMKLFKRK